MFIFWDENSPQTSLMLCITVVLVLVLLWYISKQEYTSACDRRLYNMYYQAHMNKGVVTHTAVLPPTKDGVTSTCGTMLEKHRLDGFNPEKGIMDEHKAGKTLNDRIKTLDDPLTLDQLEILVGQQNETADDQLLRSLTMAAYDGPQMEGMSAPVDQMERAYMSRQDKKKQEVYGEQAHLPTSADALSELNM